MPSSPQTKRESEKQMRQKYLDAGTCGRCRKNPRTISRKGKTKGQLSIQCAACNARKSKLVCDAYRLEVTGEKVVEVQLTAMQKAVLRLPELDQKLHAAIVADKVARMRELKIAPNIETLEKEALEAIKLAGGADKWVAERRAEEARRASKEMRRSYADNYSSLDTL